MIADASSPLSLDSSFEYSSFEHSSFEDSSFEVDRSRWRYLHPASLVTAHDTLHALARWIAVFPSQWTRGVGDVLCQIGSVDLVGPLPLTIADAGVGFSYLGAPCGSRDPVVVSRRRSRTRLAAVSLDMLSEDPQVRDQASARADERRLGAVLAVAAAHFAAQSSDSSAVALSETSRVEALELLVGRSRRR